MRGFRFSVVALIALALLFNDSPTSDGRGVIPPQLSMSQTLRSWDGRGLAIPDPSYSAAEVDAEFKKFGGSRVVLKVDEAALLKNLLTQVQDDMRHLLREARIGFIGLSIADGSVEVRIRDSANVSRALAVLAGASTEPGKGLGGAVDIRADGNNTIRLKPTDTEFDDLLRATVAESIRTITRRVAMNHVHIFGARQVGPKSIELILPGWMDASRVPRHMYSTSNMSIRLLEGVGAKHAPRDNRIANMEVLPAFNSDVPHLVQKAALLNGQHVRYAAAVLEPHTLKPMVAFRLSAQAAGPFAKATQENIGRSIAIELDNRIAATPVIRDRISNGRGRIDGPFTIDEARQLAQYLRFGILEVPRVLVEEEHVVAAAKP